jgi:hypothetical protein
MLFEDGILHLNPFLKWKIEKQKSPVVLTGDTRSSRLVRLFQKHRIGRMFIEKPIRPYVGEKWGFDNGAYGDFLRGKEFDADRYKRNLEKAIKIAETYHSPYLAVLPDIVGGGMRSLELSLEWLDRELRYIPFNWYLAVQDGMSLEEVKRVLIHYPQIKGLFLGGTDEFKKTAPLWSSLAHSLGRKFHYARAGSIRKVREAVKANADSLDSSLPLWSGEKLKRFLKALNPTMELPLFETVKA